MQYWITTDATRLRYFCLKIRFGMKHHIAIVLILSTFGCGPAEPIDLPIPTQICITTKHHGLPVSDCTIYVKYHADSFPGYDQPLGYFDVVFKTDKNARGCIQPVPEGRHWLVAIGYDSLYYPHDVMGNLPVTISLDGVAKFDSVIYVTEKH